jgi:O-antigen/teichoic acid export membrane protein
METNNQMPKRRLATNSVFSFGAWAFPMVVGFVTTPILIKKLGTEQYGILAIILAFLSYSFTFGIGKVVAKFVPEFRAAGNISKVNEVISATLWFSLLIGLIGSVAVAIWARYIVEDILLIVPDYQVTATIALYLACAGAVILMLSQTFQYVLQSLHRFANFSALTSLSGLLLGLGNIVLVLIGYGIVELLWWNLFVVVVTGTLFFLQTRRFLPDFTLTVKIDKALLKGVLEYGSNIIFFQIFTNVLYIFERAWVTRRFGSEAVTFYTVPMLLAFYIHHIVSSFGLALFPRINELLNEREALVALYQRSSKVVLAVVAFVCLSFICAGKMFLTMWVNADFAANSYSILVIHSLTFALLALTIIPLQIAEAYKFSRLTVLVTFVWMVVGIPLMIFAADPWGSAGVALSRLAVVVITFPLVLFVERQFLGNILWSSWLASCVRILAAAVAMSVAAFQIFSRFPDGWITLFVGIATCGLIYFGILLVTGYLTRQERELIRSLVGNGRRLGFHANF